MFRSFPVHILLIDIDSDREHAKFLKTLQFYLPVICGGTIHQSSLPHSCILAEMRASLSPYAIPLTEFVSGTFLVNFFRYILVWFEILEVFNGQLTF